MTTHINNVPDYAKSYSYFVARKVNDELWFYGAWDAYSDAEDVAISVDGIVVTNIDAFKS